MVIISFSVLEDKLLAGTKTRTMRPAVYAGKENTKWGRVYEKFHKYDSYEGFKALGNGNYLPLPKTKYMIPLQVYWKSRSAKIVGYHCGCGDILKKGEICMGCNTPAETPVRESYKMFDAVLVNITKKKLGALTEEEWQLDGFADRDDGTDWFIDTYKLKNILECINFEVYIIEFRRV